MTGFFWLASYPKSGNTWLRLALSSFQRHGAPVDFSQKTDFAPVASARNRFDYVLGLESSDLTDTEIACLRPRAYEAEAATARNPLFRKVHDAWLLTPAGEPLFPPAITLGSLYIVRDPRDVAASFAAHSGHSLDQAIARMADASNTLSQQTRRLDEQLPQRLGRWSEHVRSWQQSQGQRPPLLLRYEDMLADPFTSFRRVLDYIDWPAETETLAKAVAATRFERLQAAETQYGFDERPVTADRFFRRGVAGGWRTSLTEAQVTRIEANHGAVMRDFGYL